MDCGALYCMYPDRSVKKFLDGVGISNGIAFSQDSKIMYYIDSNLKRIDAFDYNVESGELLQETRRTVGRIPEKLGWPDGMTIDNQGKLWVGQWDGGCLSRWDPTTGQLMTTVELPCSRITSAIFGGPELDELYVTSASFKLDVNKEPLAGAIFRVRIPGVKGAAPEPYFALSSKH